MSTPRQSKTKPTLKKKSNSAKRSLNQSKPKERTTSQPPSLEKTTNRKWSVEKIWTKKLGASFTPISSYFLENYHRLQYPITPVELTVIVHLLKYKWDDKMPFPKIGTLAKRMLRSEQSVRTALRSLENKGYLRRQMRSGRTNLFDFQPLFNKLEKMMEEDKTIKLNAPYSDDDDG